MGYFLNKMLDDLEDKDAFAKVAQAISKRPYTIEDIKRDLRLARIDPKEYTQKQLQEMTEKANKT